MPIILGVNNDEVNVSTTATLIKQSGDNIEGVQLMPYHSFGVGKYEALGRAYSMKGLLIADKQHVEQVKELFSSLGGTAIFPDS